MIIKYTNMLLDILVIYHFFFFIIYILFIKALCSNCYKISEIKTQVYT